MGRVRNATVMSGYATVMSGYATRRSCQVVWLTAYSIHMTGYLTLVLCVLVGIVEVGLSRRDDARARASAQGVYLSVSSGMAAWRARMHAHGRRRAKGITYST